MIEIAKKISIKNMEEMFQEFETKLETVKTK